jgi:integrase
LAAAPAKLRTGKNAAEPNERPTNKGDPEAVRRRRATANRTLTILKAALNHAFREGHAASDDAWRRVKPFREVDTAKVRYLTHKEAKRLVNAAHMPFRSLVQCALLTGCRYGEIVGLCASAISIEQLEPSQSERLRVASRVTSC